MTHRMKHVRQAGLSYMEGLVATALIALPLIPRLDSLKPGLQGSQIHRQKAEVHFALKGKMEQVLAENFHDLDAAATAAGTYTTATSYSDTGASVPHEVFIWRWDADNADADGDSFTGGEDDLLWVRVATTDGSTELQTLVARK